MKYLNLLSLICFCILTLSTCTKKAQQDDYSEQRPSAPILIAPFNDQKQLPLSVNLEWKESVDPNGLLVTYDVYCDGLKGTTLVGHRLQQPRMTVHHLEGATRYSWKVIARNQYDYFSSVPIQYFTTGDYRTAELATQVDLNNGANSLLVGCSVSSEGSHPVNERGICWSTKADPTISDQLVVMGSGVGSTSVVFPVKKDTLYFIRAYAKSESGTFYGSLHKFPSVRDFEGNEYHIVQIGNQTWMAENLRSTQYADGTKIGSHWKDKTDSLYINTFGRFYYKYEAMKGDSVEGIQGACPTGWHLPTSSEYEVLIDFLGGSAIAGGKMKQAGFRYWRPPNIGANNVSKFNAVPTFLSGLSGFGGSNYDTTTSFWSSSWLIYSLYYKDAMVGSYLIGNYSSFISTTSCIRCMQN